MNPRFYDRLAAAVSIGLLLTLAAGSYYLSEIAQRFVMPGLVQDTADIADAFGENVLLLRLNDRGEPAFRMSADRMEHFRRSDTTRYTRPTMVSLDPAQPRVTVTALRGQSVRESQETILEGSVQLDRPGTAIDPPMQIRTEFARVFSDREVAITDRPVVVTRGQSTLTGTGMEFNNRARTLRVDSEARGVWVSERRNP
ncbi:MAG: LPS export ABC transporter periplasmic protein LptC [Betaproteobacteria bacterium]|nr:LPS export ABC transporter periplasmic protein LptC [Betaproteobacteria bacterium]